MSKAFTKETDEAEEPDEQKQPETLSSNVKNYVTPDGFSLLQDEMRHLLNEERPRIVAVVKWAAGNGDRSENGDYIYGKRRLREIDRRVRYLTKRLESAQIVDPKDQQTLTNVFFGATVTYSQDDGSMTTVKIVGVDEADIAKGKVSWISPLAKALLKSGPGDIVQFRTPSGVLRLKIMTVTYSI